MTASIGDIAGRLNADCERIAIHLFGEPNRHLCNRSEWRWGEHGRFKLAIAGAHRGKWSDWRTDEHGDMLDLVRRELGLDRRGAVDWALDWLGGDIVDAPPLRQAQRPAGRPPPGADDERLRLQRRALAIWAEAGPVPGTLTAHYLAEERGLPLSNDILAADAFRHHGRLFYAPEGCHVPGMVALMRDPVSAEPVGIQRTFLSPDGQQLGRAMLGSAGAVMLLPSEEVEYGLGLTEGVEDAIAVMVLGGWRPVWAAMSAGAIRNFPVLPGIEALTVFADNDVAGMEAARACGERWAAAGREATIAAPPASQTDWNDRLRGVVT